MKEKTLRFSELPKNVQARLCQVYGPQPEGGYAAHRISYVRKLTDYESWFFGRGNFLSPSFLTQTLYKLQGTLSPLRFNRALRDLDVQEDVLRTNYCRVGDHVLAVVVRERQYKESVIYQNLQGRDPEEINNMLWKAAAAALRYPFDVEKGELLRIYVFHTGMDEYAVLLTAAQIIMDRFDVRAICRIAMGLPEGPRRAVPALNRNVQMEAKMYEYWKKLLAAPPRTGSLPWEIAGAPPHPYKQRACRVVFPEGMYSDLTAEAKGNRLMLLSFLTTAWGLLLQTEGRVRDLCFCLLTPERGKKNDAWRPFQMVPMRQTADRGETIGDLVKRQFQQFLVSQPYASFDWESFGSLLGGGEKPFSHFLDFYDFLSEEKPYFMQPATPEGNLIAWHSWDAQSMKLSLYFRNFKSTASVVLLYDEDSFEPGTGERIAKSYLLTIQQMMTDSQATFVEFQEHLLERLRTEAKIQAAHQEEEKARLQNAVSSIHLLQGTDAGTTLRFMQEGTLHTYFEGDRVEGMGTHLLFVAEGRLVRSIEDSEGWFRTLNIAKKGAWLNENVMLETPKATLAAEVLSERATILAVPKDAMQNIIGMYPGLWHNITAHVITQLENYQKLWAQS